MAKVTLVQEDYLLIIIEGLAYHSDILSDFFINTAKETFTCQKDYSKFLNELTKANNYLHDLMVKKAYQLGTVEQVKSTEYSKGQTGLSFLAYPLKFEIVKATVDNVGIDLTEELTHLKCTGFLKGEQVLYSKTQIERAKEILEEDISLLKGGVMFNNNYDTSSLTEVVYHSHIDKFVSVENRLLQDKFLNKNCEWVRQKIELVALIHLLNVYKYFKPITGRSKNNYFKYYRLFFNSRYNIDIAGMAKPSKFPITKLNKYKPTFHFIAAINNR